jgi:hypothetical protein
MLKARVITVAALLATFVAGTGWTGWSNGGGW